MPLSRVHIFRELLTHSSGCELEGHHEARVDKKRATAAGSLCVTAPRSLDARAGNLTRGFHDVEPHKNRVRAGIDTDYLRGFRSICDSVEGRRIGDALAKRAIAPAGVTDLVCLRLVHQGEVVGIALYGAGRGFEPVAVDLVHAAQDVLTSCLNVVGRRGRAVSRKRYSRRRESGENHRETQTTDSRTHA